MSNPRDKNCDIKPPHKHKSRKHHSTTSCSSESESDKHLNKKVEKLENKVKENRNKDIKEDADLEEKLKKLNCKLKENEKKDKKFRLKYKTVVHRLRREKCLMVNGCDAYGSFYSTGAQTVKPNDNIKFEKKVNNLNLKLRSNGNGVKVLREGVYIVNLTAQFDQPCQVAFFINDDPELSTVTASNNPTNTVTIHQVVKLYENDFVSFRNYLSSTDITTTVPTSGLIPCSSNVEFSLWRIAPIPEKHCLPPPLNENPWCYSDTEYSSESSSDHK